MRALSIVSAVLLVAGVARADDRRHNLGDGFLLIIEDGGLYVVKAKRRARVVEAQAIARVDVDSESKKVDVEVEDVSCAGTSTYSWTLAYLEARIENSNAFSLHKKKDYVGAAQGFARAASLDPAWKVPAFNQASACQLGGHPDEAMAALAPWLNAEPIETLLHIATDPELAPLLARPELQALHAKKPTTVVVAPTGQNVVLGFSAEKNLLALVRQEASWGSSAFEATVELFDAATGKRVAATPLLKWSETLDDSEGVKPRARASVVKRAKAIGQVLGELGFAKVKLLEEGKPVDDGDESKGTRLRFAKAKLGVVVTETARVLSGDTELGQAPIEGQKSVAATYVGDARVVLVRALRPGREGCEGSDPTFAVVIPVKPVN